MFFADGAAFALQWRTFNLDNTHIGSGFLTLSGAGLGGVLQRLYPAYEGLRSLLEFNIKMARAQAQAQAQARVLAASLEADVVKPTDNSPYPRMRSAG